MFCGMFDDFWVTMRMDADSEGVFWTPLTPKKMDSEQIVVLYHGTVPPNHRTKIVVHRQKVGNFLLHHLNNTVFFQHMSIYWDVHGSDRN